MLLHTCRELSRKLSEFDRPKPHRVVLLRDRKVLQLGDALRPVDTCMGDQMCMMIGPASNKAPKVMSNQSLV